MLLENIASREPRVSICPLSTVEQLRCGIREVAGDYLGSVRLVLVPCAANKARLLVNGWGRSLLRELGMVEGSKVFLAAVPPTDALDAEQAWGDDLEARAKWPSYHSRCCC